MKHYKEQQSLQREFEKDKGAKPKASTELWTLRKTEKTLASQNRFFFFDIFSLTRFQLQRGARS